MPKVSLIIPVYNVENYIEKCLDSVINQTLKDIEIIIVNDGSKDTSKEKIEKYLKSGRVAVNTMQVPVSATPVNQTQNYNLNNRVQSTPTVASNTVKQNTMANKTKQYSSDLSKSWTTIVKDLKQNGKIVLYTNLINTKAVELNDMTVGIEFPRGMTPFGRTVLEKQENIREISNLVSMACGKEMQIKYITQEQQINKPNNEDDLKNLANESNIPFNIIE